MVWPSRSGGVEAARAAKPSGVISPVPAPIRAALARMPPRPGSTAQPSPAAVTARPQTRPVPVVRRPASSARPAYGWTTAAVAASTDTAAPVATVPSPAAAPDTGRKPTPTDSAAVAAARAAVGARKARDVSRLARSTTVCRALGSGATAGTTSAAHPATATASTAMTANSSRSPPTHASTPPRSGPRV
ncbi:hypothetical protein GCM10022224_004140 [Nonomuraea antimicrobica]|uniref:Uncharacterized protein n=1 Tax=Nonomuraea antimicrobica TaxID=561173 RepID=A0ABP7B116_9ACTN